MADSASGPGLNRYRIFVGITAGAAALILLITQVVGGEEEEASPQPGPTEAAAEEILLEPLSYTPPDPFTEPLTPEETPPPGTTPETAVDTPLSGDALLPVEPASAGAIRSAPAETVGLYGGSLNYSRCHRQKLVDFMESSPDKARAWVDAFNRDRTFSWSGGSRLEPFQIRDYVFELTPVILRADTWVTNHGYSNGRATQIQSVLQAGTAVLVDRFGFPRVKCYCGNPLLPPKSFPPVYRGPRWPGFDPRKVTIVTASHTIIDTFALTNIVTGTRLDRPATTDGTRDVSPDVVSSPTPPPTPRSTNLSLRASASASTEYPTGEFPARFSIDNLKSTSWFSAGPGPDGTTTYTITLAQPSTITRIEFWGNEQHPDFPTGFGFGAWTIDLIDAGGNSLHTIQSRGSGVTSQKHQVPNIPGVVEIRFTGSGHESLDCGGFSELWAFGYPS